MYSLGLILLGIFMVLFGCCEISIKIKNPHPTELTCKEYFERGTQASWVTLKNCDVSYYDFVTTYRDRRASDYSDAEQKWYVPVTDRSTDDAGLIVEVGDRETLDLLKKFRALDWRAANYADGKVEYDEFITKNKEKLDAQGVVLTGMLDIFYPEETNSFRKLKKRLSPLAKVVRQGQEPNLQFALASLIGGLLAVFFGIKLKSLFRLRA